ncbi:MAG: hypothetical protein M3P37_12915 [Actinomycetota bacterium]|nr:hypothetical protein [Actinomycetota bacterium]
MRFRFGWSFCLMVLVVGLWPVFARPVLASCAGSGTAWGDLIASGTVENIEASQGSSRIEVTLDRVSGGDKSKSGQTIYIRSDSGIGEASSVDVSFRQGARYMLYLQRRGDEWTTTACMGTREIAGPDTPVPASEEVSLAASPSMPQTGGPDILPLAALVGLMASGIGVVWRWAR